MTTAIDDREDAWVEEVRRYHPQLTEKALVNLVNGLEVVDDHLRSRGTQHPLLGRVWRSVTGKASREQYIIDINLKTGLSAVTEWLQDLQVFQARSDLALALVSEKLVETREEIGGRLDEVAAVIDMTLQNFDARLSSVSLRVRELEMRDKARNHLELLLVRGCEGTPRDLPPIAQAFVEIDELWWGDFGAYYRMTDNEEAKRQLVRIAHGKISGLFAERLGLPVHEILAVEDLLKPLLKLDGNEGELISYLADYSASDRVPLTRTIARVAEGRLDIQAAPKTLPLALSPFGVTQRLLLEGRLATSEVGR